MADASILRSDFYVYVLFRETGVPFYVGLGRNHRWMVHEYNARPGRSYKDNIICGMKARGIEVPKIKVAEGLTKSQAAEIEIALIAAIGRCPNGPLANRTRGGDGIAELSEQARLLKNAKIRAALRGRSPSAKTMAAAHSPEIHAKIGAAQRGRKRQPHTQEWRDRMRAIMAEQSRQNPALRDGFTMRGRRHSEDTIKKMKNAAKGRTLSAETREKISAAQTGKKRGPRSEEDRRKISLTQKGKPCPSRGNRYG